MPGITLQLSGREDVALATALTTLTCEVLKKRPEQTTVLVRFVPPELW